MERLLSTSSVRMSPQNWQAILIVALLVSTKVWEDVHPWNADYAIILGRAAELRLTSPRSLYHLESRFMQGLNWSVSVPGEVYARYYFALRDADTLKSPLLRRRLEDTHRHPRSMSASLSCISEAPAFQVGDSWDGAPEGAARAHESHVMEFHYDDHTNLVGTCNASTYHPNSGSIGNGMPLSFKAATPPKKGLRKSESMPSAAAYLAAHQAVGSPGDRPEDEKHLHVSDLWWTSRTSPYVGNFRHAPRASPPSRHINGPLDWRLSDPLTGSPAGELILPAEELRLSAPRPPLALVRQRSPSPSLRSGDMRGPPL